MRHIAGLMAVSMIALAPAAGAATLKHVDIITMVDTPQLVELEGGIEKGLSEIGLGKDKVAIDFKSAQGNFGTAQQIVRGFVGDSPDAIVAITTAPSQAAAAATKDIPVVFSAVTDAVRAKVVTSNVHPGGNVTGVCDEVPYGRQIDLIKQLVPKLKTLGIVYDPGMDSSLSSIDRIKALAQQSGFTVLLSPAVDGNSVAAAGQNLVGRADAIYVPNDTTVLAAIEALVKVGQDAQLPIFTGERRSVQRGSVATIGYDFEEIGRITAGLVKQVLDGTKPGDIDVVMMENQDKGMSLVFNKTTAAKMGVTIPPELLAKASQVY